MESSTAQEDEPLLPQMDDSSAPPVISRSTGDEDISVPMENQPSTGQSAGASQAPLRGLRLTFSGLSCGVLSKDNPPKEITILQKMSGFCLPGEMTAIMGPSGSGKTVLLDILSARKNIGHIEGEIKYSAQSPTASFLRKHTGYVEQFSSLIENLTVYEMLTYTAQLKRPFEEPRNEKKRAVDELIEKLALSSCRDIKIGDPHLDRGISGGQNKRVNIGVALITNPLFLFMDEPISGLDSYTANEVMEVVKSLIDDGISLCAALHSPTPMTFRLFDRIILLVQGTMVFFGKRAEMSDYFSHAPIKDKDIDPNESTAEWVTRIIVKADYDKTTGVLTENYNNSTLFLENQKLIDESNQTTETSAENMFAQAQAESATKPLWFILAILLMFRTVKNYSTVSFWIARSVDKTVLVILLVSMYHGLGSDFSYLNFTNISAFMFIWTGFGATGALVYVPKMVIERWVFYREQKDGLYPVIVYFFVKVVEEYIVAFLLSIIYCAILWAIIELQGSFATFLFTFFGMFCSSIVLALLFGAIAPNMDVANAYFPCYLITLMFYAGYLLLPGDIPSYLVWYSKLDFLKYSYGAFMVNHYESHRNVPDAMGSTPGSLLKTLELDDVDAGDYCGAMYVFVVVFGLLAYLAMRYVRFERKA
eukprot:g2657.t1